MARHLLLILGIAVFGVHAKDLLQRIARSSECDYCQRYSASEEHPSPPPPPGFPPPPGPFWHPPPPPPPPPSYHARQWTGLSKSIDGTPQGIYSGATASFNGPTRSTGQVYSVASAAVDDCGDNENEHIGHKLDIDKHLINENNNFNRGENKVGESFKQADRFNIDSHTSAEHQKNYSPNILRGDISDHEQAQIHGGTFENIHSNDKSFYDHNLQTSNSNHGAPYNIKSTNYGKADANKIKSDHQATVNGALNLAAQGLEAAEKTKECSSCGRNNYAASNASSYSGDAVAIAIGG